MKKSKWYSWEDIAKNYYLSKWYSLLAQNYTIKWWEIDLIFETAENLIFVEVKVIDYIDDIFDYITKKKLKFLSKTIISYLSANPSFKDYSLDVVFIKNSDIFEVYENVSI